MALGEFLRVMLFLSKAWIQERVRVLVAVDIRHLRILLGTWCFLLCIHTSYRVTNGEQVFSWLQVRRRLVT